MHLRIGNQSAFSAPSLLAPFDFAIANRFNAFEFFPDGWSDEALGETARAHVRGVAQDNDVRLSVHARLHASPLTEEGLSELRKDIRLADELDARLLNIHLVLSDGMDAFVNGVARIVDELGPLGIDLSIENTPLTGPADFNELFARLDTRGVRTRCDVGLCLDLGHANLCEATRNDYLRFIDSLAANVPITHIHAHENYGDRDSHLTLFTGPAGQNPAGVEGWLARLQARRFKGCVILEQWPEPASLLVAARDRLAEMAGRQVTVDVPRLDEPDVVTAFADGDRANPSWRQKLAWVERFLCSRADSDVEALAHTAIYLRFVGTGEIPCTEGGGHYRPCHHARIAARILDRLDAMRSPETSFAIRRIQPWLPSVHEQFSRAEPLTRIRDIAHRNDIPQALKREIKTTLQNKLHRNAGPEDLKTSAEFLARFEADPAAYPAAFREEFRRFHRELESFFHAGSLRDQLLDLAGHSPPQAQRHIRNLLDAMVSSESLADVARTHGLVTSLRQWLCRGGSTAKSDAQSNTLTEIRLEEYSFTILSRINNELESSVELDWHLALSVLTDLLDGLQISAVEPENAGCVARELRAWREPFDPHDRWQLLRMAGTVERARRLAETFSGRVHDLFGDRFDQLGEALGVRPESRRLLAESEIRTHPVFQLSRLCTAILHRANRALGASPWNVIARGRAVGTLITMHELTVHPSAHDKLIALVRSVTGDEDLPDAIAALLVAHDVPHLSHLAIRARQQGIVMACAQDPSVADTLQSSSGHRVVVDTRAPDGQLVRTARPEDRPGTRTTIHGGGSVLTTRESDADWIPLEEIDEATGGAKAANCGKLLRLPRVDGCDFEAATGWVIPFGAMERALRRRGAHTRYEELVTQAAVAGDPEACNEVQSLIRQLEVPSSIRASLIDRLGSDARVMVRSSASVEDRAGASAAGLYETISNVKPADVEQSVREVWASLWSSRAARSRARERAPAAPRMAVLIQPVVESEYAFVVHTLNPMARHASEVLIELVAGMGETLARPDVPGSPYRLAYDTENDDVRVLAFDSFDCAIGLAREGGVARTRLDHTKLKFSTDRVYQTVCGKRIARVCVSIASALGGHQDIEGAMVGDKLFILQSRPQHHRDPS